MLSIQRHLVTVTTDRDLLAISLARSMLDRSAAFAERDAALEALRSAREELHRVACGDAPLPAALLSPTAIEERLAPAESNPPAELSIGVT